MPMTWDADADARLFAAVLATSEIKIDYPAVAARMGNGCTAKAVTHRITNIKNKAKSLETDGDAPLPTPAASNGAGGRKRGPNKAKSTKAGEKVNDSEEADGAAAKPAAKKRKTTANGAKSAGPKKAVAPETAEPVKKEEEVEGDDTGESEEQEAKDEESA